MNSTTRIVHVAAYGYANNILVHVLVASYGYANNILINMHRFKHKCMQSSGTKKSVHYVKGVSTSKSQISVHI